MLLMPVTDRAGLPRRAVLVVVESPEMNQADHQLLGSMLGAIKLQPEDYQLVQTAAGADQTTGVVSCRELVAEIQPKAILVMSKLADSTVLQPLDSLRAQIHLTDWSRAQVAVTLHPRDINDNPASKRPAWEDLKRFKAALDT